ncbi:MAG: FKBP-type peptidyl-prolyl cis-trans isomerase [Bacteroidales bacterium]|nr:FKBP-type peptidyl-prolyl cis-trans isomerase [Bacteroidales bacterium]
MKKLIYVAAASMLATMGLSNCGSNVPAPKFNNGLDSLGYAYGLMIGSQYSNFTDSGVVVPGETMELDNFLAAFVSAIKKDSSDLKMTQDEAREFIQQYNQKIQQKMDEERKAKVEQEKAKGQEFMANNATQEGVITLESGLQIKHIVEGTGKSPVESDQVKVAYKGTTIDGTVFDENEEMTFPLNGVVKGFKEGLMNMKVGGKSIITMPSDLAYGDRGAGPKIPGGATLQFEITLKEIVKK